MGLKTFLTSCMPAAALGVLAACSGGSQVAQLPNQGLMQQSRAPLAHSVSFVDVLGRGTPLIDRSGLIIIDPATFKPQIYVSQYGVPSNPGLVNDYNAGTPRLNPICQLTGLTGVNAIEVDGTGELWIPQETPSGVNEVTSNAPNCGKAGTTLSDPNGQPADIAFAPNGTTFVSDILGNGSVAGDVSVYPKGKTAPTTKLTNSRVFFSLGVAVDSSGNLFESFINQSATKGGVLEFTGGKMPGKLIAGIKLVEPGTLIIDKKNDIITTDQVGGTVDTYVPPYTKAPATFPTKGKSIQCSINAGETTIACADGANDTVDVYKYPSGTYSYSFDAKLSSTLTTIGVAEDPRN